MTGGRAPKDAGARFERAVVDFLVLNGFPYAERAYGAGRPDDRGDIDGLPGWVIQCRATRDHDLAGALRAAESQCRSRFDHAAALIKCRQKPIGDAYAVMRLSTFAATALGERIPELGS